MLLIDHIFSAEKLLNRINLVQVNEVNEENLISVAVDGETFGHHKRYTERTLSYLFSELITYSEYTVTNLGRFLSDHTPRIQK